MTFGHHNSMGRSMTIGLGHWRELRRELMLPLLLLALVVRAIVPAGYMPSFSAGSVDLVLCSVDAGRLIEVDFGKSEPAGGKHMADAPCAFAGLTGPLLADLRIAALPFLFALILEPILGAAIADLTTHRLAAPPPPALGPPAHA